MKTMILKIELRFLVIIAATFLNINLYSQQTPVSATINATGIVLGQITVVSKSDLDFGTLIPGTPTIVNKESENSGRLVIKGEIRKNVTINIQLPENLTSESNQIPLSFSKTDGGYRNNGALVNSFDPSKKLTTMLSNEGKLELFLGGKVSPSVSQAPGDYTASIIFTISYMDN